MGSFISAHETWHQHFTCSVQYNYQNNSTKTWPLRAVTKTATDKKKLPGVAKPSVLKTVWARVWHTWTRPAVCVQNLQKRTTSNAYADKLIHRRNLGSKFTAPALMFIKLHGPTLAQWDPKGYGTTWLWCCPFSTMIWRTLKLLKISSSPTHHILLLLLLLLLQMEDFYFSHWCVLSKARSKLSQCLARSHDELVFYITELNIIAYTVT